MMPRWVQAALLSAAVGALGCGAAAASPEVADVHEIAFVSGADGATLEFASVAEMAKRADVVLMGEVHGHPRGLDVAARIFAEMAPIETSALSLEFFERDEQRVLSDYVGGRIDADSFSKQSKRSASNYPPGHRRMVELAREYRRAAYAANAPRRYARLARVEGFDALRALPTEEQAFFSIPETLPGGAYRDAFAALMGADGHSGQAHGDPHHAMAVDVDGFFRAQSLWDETMARTLAGALGDGRRPVFHVAGRFHVDHDGGLLQQLRAAEPNAKVLSVSASDEWLKPLDDEDRGRADVIVYVGPNEE